MNITPDSHSCDMISLSHAIKGPPAGGWGGEEGELGRHLCSSDERLFGGSRL